MQKPDVANVRTGIPLASIMGGFSSRFRKKSRSTIHVECGGGDLDSFGKYYRPGCRFADRRGFVYEQRDGKSEKESRSCRWNTAHWAARS